jgi:hypothetical protein
MELDNIKVVKKIKPLVKKQDDKPELEEIKLVNVNVNDEDEVVVKKKVIKRVVKKIKQEDSNDEYCFDKKIITAALLKKKNNTFYTDYVQNKLFNPEWVELVLSILSEHTLEDFNILNQLFENAKDSQYVDNVEIISKIIKDNLDYYENHGNNWIDKYMTKYQWLRININNGFIVTSEIISKIGKYFLIYDELTLVHCEKTNSREPWQNQKFIEKLYKTEAIIFKLFIDKHLTTDKNKQKFINLSEAYFKKNAHNFNNNNNYIIGIYTQFMLSIPNYYNDYIMILFLHDCDNFYNFVLENKKYFLQDISTDVINNYMKKHNKLIDFNKMDDITKEYNYNFADQQILNLINNIHYYKLTEFKKMNMLDLLKYYKTAIQGDRIEKLEYMYDGKFTDEDYYSLMLIYEFTDELLKKYGQNILKNNELSKKIFYNAVNVGNELIVEYFLNNKYNVTDEDILNTKFSEILILYKQNNIFMTKDVLYKYYRKHYNNNMTLDNLICFTEYHNHPEDFKEISKEIELTDFEELICNNENIYMIINELEKNPIITLNTIVYLANSESKNILYDYYRKVRNLSLP